MQRAQQIPPTVMGRGQNAERPAIHGRKACTVRTHTHACTVRTHTHTTHEVQDGAKGHVGLRQTRACPLMQARMWASRTTSCSSKCAHTQTYNNRQEQGTHLGGGGVVRVMRAPPQPHLLCSRAGSIGGRGWTKMARPCRKRTSMTHQPTFPIRAHTHTHTPLAPPAHGGSGQMYMHPRPHPCRAGPPHRPSPPVMGAPGHGTVLLAPFPLPPPFLWPDRKRRCASQQQQEPFAGPINGLSSLGGCPPPPPA